jgi:hypothetical protein
MRRPDESVGLMSVTPHADHEDTRPQQLHLFNELSCMHQLEWHNNFASEAVLAEVCSVVICLTYTIKTLP